MIRYFDTSAIAKILVEEQHARALRATLPSWARDTWLSSQLMATELHRMAARAAMPTEAVGVAIGAFQLVDVEREDLVRARTLASVNARTVDAVHIAVALRVGAQCIVTYDHRQGEVARSLGLLVVSPV